MGTSLFGFCSIHAEHHGLRLASIPERDRLPGVDLQEIANRAVAEWRGGRTVTAMREVYGVTLDIDRYTVRVTPERLQPDYGVSVIVTVMLSRHVVGSITVAVTDA
jgi:hypothetical protein